MIKAVIFDMDGLLINSEPLWQISITKVLNSKGVELSIDECKTTTGMRVDKVVEYWSLKYPVIKLDLKATVLEILQTIEDLVLEQGKAMPGVYQIIDFFDKKGISMAVASSSANSLINTVIDKLNLHNKFKVIQSAEYLKYGKPHPEVFINTANILNKEPSECLVFEDSVYGVLSAKSAMMRVVAVPEIENINNKGFCIADKKLKSLEDFNLEIWEELNSI